MAMDWKRVPQMQEAVNIVLGDEMLSSLTEAEMCDVLRVEHEQCETEDDRRCFFRFYGYRDQIANQFNIGKPQAVAAILIFRLITDVEVLA